MNRILQTHVFSDWLRRLGDAKAKGAIVARIEAATLGHFGDCKAVGDGVREMRVRTGPGYRVYFMRQDKVVHLLLCDGDKSSQRSDIRRARSMADQFRSGAENRRDEE